MTCLDYTGHFFVLCLLSQMFFISIFCKEAYSRNKNAGEMHTAGQSRVQQDRSWHGRKKQNGVEQNRLEHARGEEGKEHSNVEYSYYSTLEQSMVY